VQHDRPGQHLILSLTQVHASLHPALYGLAVSLLEHPGLLGIEEQMGFKIYASSPDVGI